MKIVNLGIRKIGPGLKAYLKFQGFCGSRSDDDKGLKLNLGTDPAVLEAMEKVKLDIELLKIILSASRHCRGETMGNFLDHWLKGSIPGATDTTVIRAYGAITAGRCYWHGENYKKLLKERISPMITNDVKLDDTDSSERLDIFSHLATDHLFHDVKVEKRLEYILANTEDLSITELYRMTTGTIEQWDNDLDDEEIQTGDRSPYHKLVARRVAHALKLTKKIKSTQTTALISAILEHHIGYCQVNYTPNGLIVTAVEAPKE